jgi:small-conductance mechanosensitive channel
MDRNKRPGSAENAPTWGTLVLIIDEETMHARHHRSSRFPFQLILVGVCVGALLSAAAPCRAQGAQQEIPSPTPVGEPTPIPGSQIPALTGELAGLLRGIEVRAEAEKEIDTIAEGLTTTRTAVELLENENLPLVEGDGPPQVLKDAQIEIARVERRLSGWFEKLDSRTTQLDADLTDLRRRMAIWELTLREADSAELPEALVQQTEEIIAAIGATQAKVGKRRSEVLTLQAEAAAQRSRLGALREQLADEIEARQLDLLRLDSPPLWRSLGGPRQEDLSEQVSKTAKRNLEVLVAFAREQTGKILRDILIFVVVLMLFVRLGRNAELWVRSDETLKTTAALLRRPVDSSLLVTIMLVGGWFRPSAPNAYLNLLGLIVLLVMFRLLPHLIRREMRPAVSLLVGLVALHLLVELIPSTLVLHRVCELLLAFYGALACGWTLHRQRSLEGVTKDAWYRAAMWIATAATVSFWVAAVANIIGAVAFSSTLAVSTLGSIYDAITLWLFVVVFYGAMTVALRTTVARRLFVVRYHSDRILTVTLRFLKVLAVFGWSAAALKRFGVFDWTVKSFEAVFFTEYTLGEFSLSVSSVAIFIVVIWLSVKLAQFTSFILDEDVLTRVDLPKGLPATISKTSTYLVVSIGFLVAVAAAGLDLSRATIIVGALGVGIGFGLQNAVNNFVSGLILLFGRPINVEDRIQIGEISGVVKDIGIRATVVQTWQGAEVIVPNATLISDNLINWTLSNTRRRMEIQVGVAYGSPTSKVIELLTGVARAHAEVLDDPEPVTLFQGFGASSLDFELRAWTEGDFVTIASDLRLEIDRALAENGNVIPFPQRDLHLASVDDQAASRLRGGRADSPEESAGTTDSAAAADPDSDQPIG